MLVKCFQLLKSRIIPLGSLANVHSPTTVGCLFPFNPSNFQALQKRGGQPYLNPQIWDFHLWGTGHFYSWNLGKRQDLSTGNLHGCAASISKPSLLIKEKKWVCSPASLPLPAHPCVCAQVQAHTCVCMCNIFCVPRQIVFKWKTQETIFENKPAAIRVREREMLRSLVMT